MEPMESSHPDLFGQALSGTGQKIAELASLASLVGQFAGERRMRRAAKAGQEGEADQAALEAIWSPALDPVWRADATAPGLIRAWAAALRDSDSADAGRARGLAEQQLRGRYPKAMDNYNARLAAGTPPEEAMLESVGEYAADAAALAPEEAAFMQRVLPEVARLNARSAAAGKGPLDPAAAGPVMQDGAPAGAAAAIMAGLAAAQAPAGETARGAAAPGPGGPGPGLTLRTVSARGPAAAAWPSTVQEAVAAGAGRPGGSRRTLVRPAGVVPRRQPGPGR